MPTVEIVRFPASDAFVADHLVFKDALDILNKADGVIGSPYYGIQAEDARTGYLFVTWETYQDHMNLKKHHTYPDLLHSLSLARTGPLDVQHVDFKSDVTPAFDAPATELALITVKPGASLEDFNAKFRSLGENLVKEASCRGVAVGESREHQGTWVVAIGWDSIQAHIDAVSNGVFPEIIQGLYAVSDVDLKHTELFKYSA